MAVALVGTAVLAGACGSTSTSASPTTVSVTTPATAVPATTVATGSGPVDVLYAGSLVNLMEKQIGPGFHTSSGYTFNGFSAGSSALAAQIKGKVRQGDVFVSASPSVNASLEGPANGNWVSWYASFASSPLLIGYNPHSKFAQDLQTKPWYTVITEPGFLIGRTDPVSDPKGKLTVEALDAAATAQNLPALKALGASSASVFPEETLVGRLQAGQLDAGFFYSSEAKAAGIPTVALTGSTLKATYTVTVLNQAPDQAGAEAFVLYLLSPAGQARLTADGFNLIAPAKVTGTGVPSGLQSLTATG
jgi:molybdate/tungstate transport system substrate-binding protein